MLKAIFVAAFAIFMPRFVHAADPVATQPIANVIASAKSGDKLAVHQLCYRYIYGIDAHIDYDAAVLWCSKGAALGVSNSQTLLAELYLLGNGVAVSYPAARFWYLEAAGQGHAHAMLVLYNIYKRGIGVPVDEAIAASYLKKSADTGYGPALDIQKKDGTDAH